MRPTTVVHVRVSTEDIMSAIDVVRKGGMQTEGMSLALVVKLAFSGAMEALREQGVVPRREGWEYGEMIAPFVRNTMARKVAIGQAYAEADMQRASVDMPAVRPNVSAMRPRPSSGADEAPELNMQSVRKKAQAYLRHQELAFRLKNEPDNVTAEEHAELQTLEEEWQLTH